MYTPTLEEVRSYVSRGLVSERRHNTLPLSIFKYTQMCQFSDERWDHITSFCRGVVYDTSTGRLIARSYPKFFNLGENKDSSLSSFPSREPIIQEKLDGSCIILFYYAGEWEVATMGSFHSDQAEYVREKILPKYLRRLSISAWSRERVGDGQFTYVTEVLYPKNRIVVDYGDVEELVLHGVFLGAEECSWEVVLYKAKQLGMRLPKTYSKEEVADYNKFYKNTEGYVLRWDSPNYAEAAVSRVKVKSPEYVLAHKALSELSLENVLEVHLTKNYEDYVTCLPSQIRDSYDDLVSLLKSEYSKENEELYSHLTSLQIRLGGRAYSLPFTGAARKEYAQYIKENIPTKFHCLAFQFLDGKDPWKVTKGNSPWLTILWSIVLDRLKKELK